MKDKHFEALLLTGVLFLALIIITTISTVQLEKTEQALYDTKQELSEKHFENRILQIQLHQKKNP